MLTENQYIQLIEDIEHPLSFLWYGTNNLFGLGATSLNPATFLARRDAFLWVLERLLREGKLKLAKNGVLLEGTPEELVAKFRQAWPKDEAASGYEDFGWWFFDDECPGEAVWPQPDGRFLP